MATGLTTRGNDRIIGTTQNERLEGGHGNDTLIAGGGADTLVGDAGNDRLIANDAIGTTGLRGGRDDDYLSAAVPGTGQVHMFGMDGDDTLVMDLTKEAGSGNQVRYNGHHSYGGRGADTFTFTNKAEADDIIIGRIDDFNASEDILMLDDEELDLSNPPDDVHLFAFKGQQWIQVGENAYFALEGARAGGVERHFLDNSDLQKMLLASKDPAASVAFIDQANEVPADQILPNTEFDTDRSIGGSENQTGFIGSSGSDAVYDTRVRNANIAKVVTDSRFEGRGGDDLINAGKGNDTVFGGAGDDSLAGGLDNDLLTGGAGDDLLFGGSEHDTLRGNTGNDVLEGGSGNDWLGGAENDDVMRGQHGHDILFGGAGNDRMSGGDGTDTLNGDSGNDRIYGSQGGDFLRGGSGRDTLWAGTGDDKVNGGGWDDHLHGQRGDDTLTGGHGKDTLSGGRGDDWIHGGKGQDMAWGGSGRDVFAYSDEDLINWTSLSGDTHTRADQLDRIEDFVIGEDTIVLSGFDQTDGLSDLDATTLILDGKTYGMLSVEETNQRVLVQIEREEAIEALMEEENFAFL